MHPEASTPTTPLRPPLPKPTASPATHTPTSLSRAALPIAHLVSFSPPPPRVRLLLLRTPPRRELPKLGCSHWWRPPGPLHVRVPVDPPPPPPSRESPAQRLAGGTRWRPWRSSRRSTPRRRPRSTPCASASASAGRCSSTP